MKIEKNENEERRVITAAIGIEEREEGQTRIVGYAAVFNKDSEDMGFIERIMPGAFKGAIKNSDVRALFNHDENIIFGRSGVNLALKEDEHGLYMEVDPIDDQDYRMVAGKVRNGLITQQSFGFTVAKDGDEWSEDYRKRTIHKVERLWDVSAVTFPAYPDTEVAFRSLNKVKEQRSKSLADVAQRARDIDELKRQTMGF